MGIPEEFRRSGKRSRFCFSPSILILGLIAVFVKSGLFIVFAVTGAEKACAEQTGSGQTVAFAVAFAFAFAVAFAVAFAFAVDVGIFDFFIGRFVGRSLLVRLEVLFFVFFLDFGFLVLELLLDELDLLGSSLVLLDILSLVSENVDGEDGHDEAEHKQNAQCSFESSVLCHYFISPFQSSEILATGLPWPRGFRPHSFASRPFGRFAFFTYSARSSPPLFASLRAGERPSGRNLRRIVSAMLT